MCYELFYGETSSPRHLIHSGFTARYDKNLHFKTDNYFCKIKITNLFRKGKPAGTAEVELIVEDHLFSLTFWHCPKSKQKGLPPINPAETATGRKFRKRTLSDGRHPQRSGGYKLYALARTIRRSNRISEP